MNFNFASEVMLIERSKGQTISDKYTNCNNRRVYIQVVEKVLNAIGNICMQRTQRPYQDDRDDIDTGWMCGKTMGVNPGKERKPKERIVRIESHQAQKINDSMAQRSAATRF